MFKTGIIPILNIRKNSEEDTRARSLLCEKNILGIFFNLMAALHIIWCTDIKYTA